MYEYYEDLNGMISVSDWGNVVSLFDDFDTFTYKDKDVVRYFIFLVDMGKIGSVTRKSDFKCYDKAVVMNALQADLLDTYNTEQCLAAGLIGVVPTRKSVLCLGEIDWFKKTEYTLAAVDASGNISIMTEHGYADFPEIHFNYDDILKMSQGKLDIYNEKSVNKDVFATSFAEVIDDIDISDNIEVKSLADEIKEIADSDLADVHENFVFKGSDEEYSDAELADNHTKNEDADSSEDAKINEEQKQNSKTFESAMKETAIASSMVPMADIESSIKSKKLAKDLDIEKCHIMFKHASNGEYIAIYYEDELIMTFTEAYRDWYAYDILSDNHECSYANAMKLMRTFDNRFVFGFFDWECKFVPIFMSNPFEMNFLEDCVDLNMKYGCAYTSYDAIICKLFDTVLHRAKFIRFDLGRIASKIAVYIDMFRRTEQLSRMAVFYPNFYYHALYKPKVNEFFSNPSENRHIYATTEDDFNIDAGSIHTHDFLDFSLVSSLLSCDTDPRYMNLDTSALYDLSEKQTSFVLNRIDNINLIGLSFTDDKTLFSILGYRFCRHSTSSYFDRVPDFPKPFVLKGAVQYLSEMHVAKDGFVNELKTKKYSLVKDSELERIRYTVACSDIFKSAAMDFLRGSKTERFSGTSVKKLVADFIDSHKYNAFYKYVTDNVIGHDNALASACYYVWTWLRSIAFDNKIVRNNIFITGGSGCGKTEFMRTLSDYFSKERCPVPVVRIDSSCLTGSGYKGQNVDEALANFCIKTNNTGIGILFLDEFDKRFNPRDREFSKMVQNNLLTVLEGSSINVTINRTNTTLMDTGNTLFIALGTCEAIREKREADRKSRIGFGTDDGSPEDEYWSDIKLEDLSIIEAKDEIVGRFSEMINFRPLKDEDLLRILHKNIDDYCKNRKSSLVKIVHITKEAEQEFIKEGKGKRGIRSMLNSLYMTLKSGFESIYKEECTNVSSFTITGINHIKINKHR